MDSSSPLIDPALLASLTESERAEALAAAAAAQRAEERAAKRAADAAKKPSTAEEEEAALAMAMEEKRRERERERALESTRMAPSKSIGSAAAADGLVFVSKKKRGGVTNGHAASHSAAASTEDILEHTIGSKRKSNDNGNSSHEPHESHLTASQLASIKRAYLGDKALEIADASNGSSNSPADMRDAISARQKLRAERAKRRVKKTTFKFEWGEEEDTFQDDDPLYNGGVSGTVKNKQPAAKRRDNPHSSSLGKRKSQQDVPTTSTVYTKPIHKMTPRDWRIFRENYDIVVKGGKSPPPLRSFREMPPGVPPINSSLLNAIENTLKYKEPSPIQRQSIPIGMQRRDLIGIAETGEFQLKFY
jgi:ATP-dependent RNA helicase DDX23/PRP28